MEDDKEAKMSRNSGTKRVRHKAYSYKTKSGKVVTVAAHYEQPGVRKPKPGKVKHE